MRREIKDNKFNKANKDNCMFCLQKLTPQYTDVSMLSKFCSERGKILSHAKTGICSKHQRLLTRAIKHARHVALMPFVVRA